MKVLNFGSLNIDYVYTVDHIVAPGETISSKSVNKFCGGKGLNQSIALAKAGVKVYHAGCIGKNDDFLIEELRNAGVDTRYIKKCEEISGHANIQVDKNGQNSILLCPGANSRISKEQIYDTFDNFDKGDWLVLQNEINNIDLLINIASKKQMKIVINPSPMNQKILSLQLELCSYLVINETEGFQISGEKEPEKIILELKKRLPNCIIILTLGKNGSIYSYQNKLIKQPIFETNVVDTTAAGDTFMGYLISSLINGKTPEYAMKRATFASAIAVSRNGAAKSIPTTKEVDNLFRT